MRWQCHHFVEPWHWCSLFQTSGDSTLGLKTRMTAPLPALDVACPYWIFGVNSGQAGARTTYHSHVECTCHSIPSTMLASFPPLLKDYIIHKSCVRLWGILFPSPTGPLPLTLHLTSPPTSHLYYFSPVSKGIWNGADCPPLESKLISLYFTNFQLNDLFEVRRGH